MKKLATWLDNNPGMATRLRIALQINATNISNWRNGHKAIPWRHMPVIAKMSKGKVSVKDMMESRVATQPGKAPVRKIT